MATPTRNSATVTYNLQISYNNEINSLIGGTKWGGSLETGVTLSYSFPEEAASFDQSYGENSNASEWHNGWHPLNTSQQLAFESALATLSGVANITFVEFSDNATTVGEVRVAMSQQVDAEGAGAWAYSPSSYPSAGDIWLSPNNFLSDPIAVGSWEFNTLIHELGHAVGLSHPFSGSSSSGASLPQGRNGTDNIFYTVMSYTIDPSGNEYFIDRYPETPMLLDIQALQYLYGENTSHHSGDTTYTFTGNGKYFETIWDGGGQDTIDYTDSTSGATIDLREGEWSSLGQPIVFTNNRGASQYTDPRTVWIAYGAEIENANGSQKDDFIYGNDLNNELYGHWGADTIFGFGGDDRLIFSLDKTVTSAFHGGSPGTAGTGDRVDFTDKKQSLDIYNGGEGNDTLSSDSNNDAVLLDDGSGSPLLVSIETIETQGGDDVVDLTSSSFVYGDISVYGGNGNDVIWSNDGNDRLYGEAGNDTIFGWVGVDYIAGGSGNDYLDGGLGNDHLNGGTGIDTANYAGNHANYTIGLTSIIDNFTSDGTDTLTSIERLSFADKTIALDIDDNAGEAYRIYKAAFDRAPDLGGLGFWINALDNGTTLLDVASGFTNSAEFSDLYGANNSNNAYLNSLYNNVLDRDGDAGGHAFWLGHLDAGTVTREQILIDFSESTENQANVIELIANGIEYTPYI